AVLVAMLIPMLANVSRTPSPLRRLQLIVSPHMNRGSSNLMARGSRGLDPARTGTGPSVSRRKSEMRQAGFKTSAKPPAAGFNAGRGIRRLVTPTETFEGPLRQQFRPILAPNVPSRLPGPAQGIDRTQTATRRRPSGPSAWG